MHEQIERKEVEKIILNEIFWSNVIYVITIRSLVQVLRMVDAERNPYMCFIYNAMDEANELIAYNIREDVINYKEIWGIIDEKWEF